MQALMSYPTLMPDPAAVLRLPVTARGSQHLILSRQQLEAWLRQAAPGDRVVYHRGHLAVDRVRGSSELSEPARRELVAVANLARTLANSAEIHLVQQRIEPGGFSYLAVKAHLASRLASTPGPAPISASGSRSACSTQEARRSTPSRPCAGSSTRAARTIRA